MSPSANGTAPDAGLAPAPGPDRATRYAWALLAMLFASAFLLNGLPYYAGVLLVLAVPAALLSATSARAAVILVVGAPALDSFAIITTRPQVVTVFQVVLVAALMGVMWRFVATRKSRAARLTLWDLGILLFFVATLVSVPFSHAVGSSIVGAIETAALAGMYLFLSTMAIEPRSRRDLSLTVIVTGGVSALVAIGQALVPRFPVPLLENNTSGNALVASRVSGFFANPNSLALLLVLAIILAVDAAIRNDSTMHRIGYGFGVLVCAAALALTYSRQAFVGLVVGVVALILFVAPTVRTRLKYTGALLVVVLALLALPGVQQRALSIVDFRSDPSAMDRAYLSEVSARMFLDRPLTGVGMSAFMAAYPEYEDPRVTISPVPNGHQMPFSIPAETGLVGLVAELVMVGFLIFASRKAPGLARSGAPVAGIAAAAAFFTMSFFNGLYFCKAFWVALALVGAVARTVPLGPAFEVESTPGRGYDLMKRIADVLGSALALIVLSPLLAIIAVSVRLVMGAPIVFRQERAGLGGRIFVLYKFRTMRDAPAGTSGIDAVASDSERLTAFGRFLRSTSLDELPQLLNVLKGDMSVVGPRPLLPEYLDRYNEQQARRHEVRPGMTGWALVNGRNALSWDERFKLDVWYVDHRSLALDARILAMTVWAVVSRKGISGQGTETMQPFEGDTGLPATKES